MSKIRKIGVFGGSFNPVHNGHIRLAELYHKNLGLDKLIVIPANIPPHKTADNLVNSEDRLAMLTLAFEPISYAEISDIELKCSGTSYTVNTISALKEQYPEDELYLIVGGDMFLYFENWKDYKKILSMCTLCTAPREVGEYDKLVEYQKKIDPALQRTKILNTSVLVVSSSEIREKINSSNQIDNLIPQKVKQYIIEKGLYKNE